MVERIEPKAGQESVWDYPRPPRVELCTRHLRILYQDVSIAETHQSLRVLETSHPPSYYLPQSAIQMQYLTPNAYRTYCEFKGEAFYWDLHYEAQTIKNVAWMYPQPNKGYETLKDHLAFYAHRVSACYVDGERVQAQAGDFYGGWVTSDIVGPFKGGAGTWGW